MNWRELLQKAVSENPYAKYAKGQLEGPPPRLLHVLHTEFNGLEITPRPSPSLPNPPAARCLAREAAPISWAQWKANALNLLFQQQGQLGERGRITAATVIHGEQFSEKKK